MTLVPCFTKTGADLVLSLAGARLIARPCGLLWWPEAGLAVVSDLHLEKGSSLAARGVMLPPYDTRVALSRLATALADVRPQRVISLGDSLHDPAGAVRMTGDDGRMLSGLVEQFEWIWIEGNHDADAAAAFGGRTASEISVGPLRFVHEPSSGSAIGEVAGHLHPCARVRGGGTSVRRRCFVSDGRRLVLPAYGALAGGLNVLDPAIAGLFPDGFSVAVLGRSETYAAAPGALLPDRRQRA